MNNPRHRGIFQWVFLIALCIFAFQQCAKAQGTPPQKVNSNYQFKSSGADSGGLRPPIYTTLPATPPSNYVSDGAIAFQSSDSSLYQWHVLSHAWTKLGTGSSSVPFLIQSFIGGIYSKGTFSNTTDFTNVGLTATATGGKIVTSGGNGTFARRLDLNRDTSTYERWKVGGIFQISAKTSNSFGPAVGYHSVNNVSPYSLFARLDATATGGTLIIYGGGGTPSVLATSSGSLSWLATDSVLLTCELNVDTAIATAYNYKNQSFVSVKYAFLNSYPQSSILPNTGNASFVNLNADGTTISIDSFFVSSRDLRNNNLLIIGDSKTRAYYGGTFPGRMYAKLGQDIQGLAISAGGGDRSTEMIAHLPSDLSRKSKYVLLNFPSNDPRFSVPVATTDSNFVQLYNSFTANGSTVIIGLPMFETSQDLSSQVTFIYNRFPSVPKIDYWSALKYNPSFLIAGDGIHPNVSGNDTCYKVTLNSWKLYGGQYFTPFPTLSLSGTNNTIAKFTSSTSVGNSVATDDGSTYTIPEPTVTGCNACNTRFVLTIKGSTGLNFKYYSFQNKIIQSAENDDRSFLDSAAIFAGPLYFGYGLYNGGSAYKATDLVRMDSTGVTIQDQAWTGTSNIGFSGNVPSAIFQINGTATTPKGFLTSRMTTVQKLAISSPAEGLSVYDLTLHQMSYFNGTAWINF